MSQVFRKLAVASSMPWDDPLPSNLSQRVKRTPNWSLPTSGPLDTGVWDNRRERRSPLLGKGGEAAPSSKWSRSFGGAAGVVRSTSDNRWLEPTTPKV